MNKNILIVEDEPLVSSFLARKLKESGFDAQVALTTHDALAFPNPLPFCLAVVSFAFEGGAGFKIAEKLKQANVPVVMLLNSEQPREIAQIRALGISDIIFKTKFDIAYIISKVAAIISQTHDKNINN